MNAKLIGEIRDNISGEILLSEPLSRHTTYRTGGKADILVQVRDGTEAEWIYRFGKQNGLPVTIIGAGSNLIVRESGIRGLVIKTKSGSASVIFDQKTRVVADAGVYLDNLIKRAAEHGFGGLNDIAGIPGTVGGAVFMNAGTGEGDVSSVIIWADAVSPGGREVRLSGGEMEFGYRKSIFQNNDWLIVRAAFRITEADRQKTLNEIDRIWKRRKKLYPMDFPTAGSVFMNPEGAHAGRLIEQAGCRGLRLGGAEVSEKHGNFIVNRNNASPDDILRLIEIVRERVSRKFGITLELEQEIMGGGSD